MLNPVGLWDGLVDDARALGPDGSLAEATASFGRARTEERAALARLVLRDEQLAAAGRLLGRGEPLPVVVVTTAGAGGLLALAGRSIPGLDVRAAVSVLRDLGDLAGNAARVVAAAAELDAGVEVCVELPGGAGWREAVETIEAGGLHGQLRADDGAPARLAERLSALVEADLPFRVAGVPDALAVVRLVLAVESLVETGDVDTAADLLGAGPERVRDGVQTWDEATAARVRRRLRAVEVADAAVVSGALARLVG